MHHRQLPEGWDKNLPTFPADPKGLAGREASGKVLNSLAQNVSWLLGGSADLSPTTKTRLTFDGAGDFTAENAGGRNLHFGLRENAIYDTYSARQGVEHDDMNVLVMGGRMIGPELARELMKVYLGADFTGEERHRLRLEKIHALEKRYSTAATHLEEEKS